MREGAEQEEMKEEDVEEDEEELLEEEQLVVKEGRKNLDGGRVGVGEGWEWEWSRQWQQCTASEGRRLLYSSQHSSSLLGPVHKYVE